jgi:hypothetical protein
MLNAFCERIPNLYIVIDAMDECENLEQQKLALDIFNDLVRKCDSYSPGKLRVLLLSRDTNEIKSMLVSADIFTLTPEHSEKDIRRYCELRLRELHNFELNKDEDKAVVEMTCDRSDGKFLTKFIKL